MFDEADILKAARQPIEDSENVFRGMVKRSAGGDKNLEEIMTEVVEDIKQEMLRTYKADEYEDLAIQAGHVLLLLFTQNQTAHSLSNHYLKHVVVN